ncbi:Lrp/AsnC family transcriptional regulator [Agromyces sp. MMS24-K17]|uniref:Lrp/AsnC family transcriptional regulator n=1 Tax=Agromyces sp. MMS24-K17 TaxID=3372850 RepID=UPI0037550A1E
MRELDDIDRHILLELQRDGRLTNQELADRVGLSPSPCLRRVRQLQDDGIITGFSAEVAPVAVGLPITAWVSLTLSSHAAEVVDEVEARLRGIPEVIEAYLLAGDDDYLARVAVASFDEYENLMRRELRAIPSIAAIKTTFAFGITKPRSPLPLP